VQSATFCTYMRAIDAGTISGQLKVRDWEAAPPVGNHLLLPQHLPPPMLPQGLLLHEQQPYTPPMVNEQQLHAPPYLPPLRPPPLHLALPPMHMVQHPMLQPPGPQQLGDGQIIMQQHHAAQQEGDYYQDAHVQGWDSGSSAWTPMGALSQTQHPAHEYGGVAQLPLEPYHSAGDSCRYIAMPWSEACMCATSEGCNAYCFLVCLKISPTEALPSGKRTCDDSLGGSTRDSCAGMHFHRLPPGSGFSNPTIAAPTLSLPFDMLTSGAT
jgi:hypothetical protein